MNTGKTRFHGDKLENSDEGSPVMHDRADTAVGDGSADVASERGASAQPTVDDLKAKIESLESSLLRAKADFQNFQRRSTAERAEAIRFANAELLRSILTVLDDFDRALAAADETDNKDAVIDGVRLVHDNLMKAFKEAGLETIDALGQAFDPNIHEALLQQPTDDFPPGTVVDQVAKGYRLRDRVLRPARVIVSKPRE